MVKKIILLGSTGSIGTQTLDIVARHPDRFEIVGLAAGRKVELVAEQIRKFRPKRVSVAVAEHQLLPAVRQAGPDAVVLADGFSCRTQLDDLAGVRAVHLAQLLAGQADSAHFVSRAAIR